MCKNNSKSDSFKAGYDDRMKISGNKKVKNLLSENIDRYEYEAGWRQAILELNLIEEIEHGFVLSEN